MKCWKGGGCFSIWDKQTTIVLNSHRKQIDMLSTKGVCFKLYYLLTISPQLVVSYYFLKSSCLRSLSIPPNNFSYILARRIPKFPGNYQNNIFSWHIYTVDMCRWCHNATRPIDRTPGSNQVRAWSLSKHHVFPMLVCKCLVWDCGTKDTVTSNTSTFYLVKT